MSERKILEKLIADGEDAKKKLEVLDGPKLRHGDCFGDEFSCLVVLRVLGEEKWDFRHKDGSGGGSDLRSEADMLVHIGKLPWLGNIFDDLKELAEPLRKFIVTEHEGRNRSVSVGIVHDAIEIVTSRVPRFTLKEAKDASMKLRRVIRTVENA